MNGFCLFLLVDNSDQMEKIKGMTKTKGFEVMLTACDAFYT